METKTVYLESAIVTISTTGGQSYSLELKQRTTNVDPYLSVSGLREAHIDLGWEGRHFYADCNTIEYLFPDVWSYRRYGYHRSPERISFLSTEGKNVTVSVGQITGFEVEKWTHEIQYYRSEVCTILKEKKVKTLIRKLLFFVEMQERVEVEHIPTIKWVLDRSDPKERPE